MTTMDSKPNPVYEDFEVHTEWVHEAVEDTLIAYLPGLFLSKFCVFILAYN